MRNINNVYMNTGKHRTTSASGTQPQSGRVFWHPTGADSAGPGPGEVETVEGIDEQMDRLVQQQARIQEQLRDPSLPPGERAALQSELKANQAAGQKLASRKDDAERARKEALGESRYGSGLKQGELPNAGGVIAAPEPRGGGNAPPRAPGARTATTSRVRIRCDFPSGDQTPGNAEYGQRAPNRWKSKPVSAEQFRSLADCEAAARAFVAMLNRDLHYGRNSSSPNVWPHVPEWTTEVEFAVQDDHLVLVDRKTHQPIQDVTKLAGALEGAGSPLAELVAMVNGPPRAPGDQDQVVLTLVNNNWSFEGDPTGYGSAAGRNEEATGAGFAYPGLTNQVVFNLEGRMQLDNELGKVNLPPTAIPLLPGLAHELAEHRSLRSRSKDDANEAGIAFERAVADALRLPTRQQAGHLPASTSADSSRIGYELPTNLVIKSQDPANRYRGPTGPATQTLRVRIDHQGGIASVEPIDEAAWRRIEASPFD